MSTKSIWQILHDGHGLTLSLTAKKKLVFGVSSLLAVSLVFMLYSINDVHTNYYQKFVADTIGKLGINATLYFNRLYNMTVSFEGDENCNLQKKTSCFVTEKSLVIAFWRHDSRNKWLAKNFLNVFDDKHFTRIIMIHDNSSWSSYPDSDRFIWIHVQAQKRFWYLKRFITPILTKTYKYIWILDDDVELLFNPLHYECVIGRLNVSLSAPGRGTGVASHPITRVDNKYIDRIGRWTDFVEIGPIFVVNSFAWNCLWHFLSSFVGMGWGFELVWCPLLTQQCPPLNPKRNESCAILDSFQVNHLSNFIGSTAVGSQEIPAYSQYYSNFHTKQIIIEPLAKDRVIFLECNKTW